MSARDYSIQHPRNYDKDRKPPRKETLTRNTRTQSYIENEYVSGKICVRQYLRSPGHKCDRKDEKKYNNPRQIMQRAEECTPGVRI